MVKENEDFIYFNEEWNKDKTESLKETKKKYIFRGNNNLHKYIIMNEEINRKEEIDDIIYE